MAAVERSLGESDRCGAALAESFEQKLPTSLRSMTVAEEAFLGNFLGLEFSPTEIPRKDSRGFENNFNS